MPVLFTASWDLLQEFEVKVPVHGHKRELRAGPHVLDLGR
jgi:hypothetical protein